MMNFLDKRKKKQYSFQAFLKRVCVCFEGRAPFSSNKYVRGHRTPTLTFPMAVESHSDIKMASCTLNMSSQYEGITGHSVECHQSWN